MSVGNSRGMTALELTLVLSTVGLTFLFALPGVASYRDSVQLNQAVTQVAGHLAIARQKAVTEHNDYVVSFTSDVEYALLDDDNGNGIADAGEKTIGPFKLPPGVRVDYMSPGPSIRFSPSGMLGAGVEQVLLDLKNSSGTTKGLTVWPSGSIELRVS